MSELKRSAKAISAEEILDAYLSPFVTAIGAKEEDEIIKILKKLPSGIDEKKLFETLKKLGALKLFRFASHFSIEYIPILRDAMKLYLADTFPSRMMNQCLAFALEKDFTQPNIYEEYCQTASFLQYLNTL